MRYYKNEKSGVYLISYSSADLDLVPSREAFSRIVLDAFENANPASKTSVMRWVCSQEPHAKGGVHYTIWLLNWTLRGDG